MYHPLTRTLESEVQALYLTKAVRKEGMPPSLVDSNEILPRDELTNSFKRSIIQSRVFSSSGERKTRNAAVPVMLNLQKVVWSHAARLPGLLDMSLSFKPHVAVSWERGKERLHVSGNLGFLLSSKHPLSPFLSEEEVKLTEMEDVGTLDIIAPVFDLHKLPCGNEVAQDFMPMRHTPTHTH